MATASNMSSDMFISLSILTCNDKKGK
jgi:hypothetical protein